MAEKNFFVKPDSISAWFLAARPKTLMAALTPVLVGLAATWWRLQMSKMTMTDSGIPLTFQWVPAVCCLFFALFAQVAANFVNDYCDYKKGNDTEERLGPRRAVASGWISPRRMLTGTFVALGIACLFGLGVVPYGGKSLIIVGAVSAIFCLLYSAGPVPLSHVGLGDALVVVFFGIVAVGFTAYIQTKEWFADLFLLGTAVGFATDNILVANNYRDREEDRKNHKWTTVALFGERFGRYFYLVNGLIAATLVEIYLLRNFPYSFLLPLIPGGYVLLHFFTWRTLVKIRQGKELNRVLALSARNLLILGILTVATIIIQALFLM